MGMGVVRVRVGVGEGEGGCGCGCVCVIAMCHLPKQLTHLCVAVGVVLACTLLCAHQESMQFRVSHDLCTV